MSLVIVRETLVIVREALETTALYLREIPGY